MFLKLKPFQFSIDNFDKLNPGKMDFTGRDSAIFTGFSFLQTLDMYHQYKF